MDEQLWVVVGDLPSAYLVTDVSPDAIAALGVYCELMEDWANAVLQETPLNEVFPVSARPTVENAHALLTRVKCLRDGIIPMLRSPR